MTSAETILRFDRVNKSFAAPGGEVEVLRGLGLQVRASEFVAITGPSGSGKSTLLHLAALLDHPTAGTVHFMGEAVSGTGEDTLSGLRKSGVGMVFQKYCLLPHRSVLDNVLFRGKGPRRPWQQWAWNGSPAARPGYCPGARCSGSPWHGRWHCARTCWWRTSPPATWTRRHRGW